MVHDAVVAASGITTGSGLSTGEVAAAVRAQTSRFAESAICDRRIKPAVLSEVPAQAFPPINEALLADLRLTGWVRRLVQLAAKALSECLPRQIGQRPPLYLALPDALPDAFATKVFLPALEQQTGGVFDRDASDVSFRGRAGGILAAGTAAKAVSSGKTPLAIAGAVDSFRNLWTLAVLEARGRLKTASNLDGFIPGEGAAFLLLARADVAQRLGLSNATFVTEHAAAMEPGHLESPEPYRGDGLATAVAALVATTGISVPIQTVFSSMNGESYWGKEWGVAFVRNRASFDDAFAMYHPADCHGDVGAASGVANIALAAHALTRHHCEGPALVYASSDGAQRAALVVARLDTGA